MLVIGLNKLVIGGYMLVIGGYMLVIGWLLDDTCWLFDDTCWLLDDTCWNLPSIKACCSIFCLELLADFYSSLRPVVGLKFYPFLGYCD